MFDKLKQIKQLKDLQDSLKKEKIEIEKDGVIIIVNGKMENESISLNNNLSPKDQEKIVKDGINEAFRKVQSLAAQKMGIF